MSLTTALSIAKKSLRETQTSVYQAEDIFKGLGKELLPVSGAHDQAIKDAFRQLSTAILDALIANEEVSQSPPD